MAAKKKAKASKVVKKVAAKPNKGNKSALKKILEVAKKIAKAPVTRAVSASKPAKGPTHKVPAAKVQKGEKSPKAAALVLAKGTKTPKESNLDKKSAKKQIVVAVEVSSSVVVKSTVPSKKGKAGASVAVKAHKDLKRKCREPACEQDTLIVGFCRLHYIKNWKKIKRKEAILATGQLNNYVEELVSKYPDRYLDVIRQDLSSEKDWAKVIVDLELDGPEDSVEEEAEAASENAGGRRERDFDDDNDAF